MWQPLRTLGRSFCSKMTLTSDNVKKSRFLEFNITGDLYRIDVGFLLLRPPIMDDITEIEMKRRVETHKFKKANNLYPKVDESLFEFNYKDPLDDMKSKDPTFRPTHEIRLGDGKYTHYHKYSKDINHIDLDERDPTSIQIYPKHTVYMLVKDEFGKWTVPNKMLEFEMPLVVSCERLKMKIFGGEVVAANVDSFPTFSLIDKIPEAELKENRLLTKVKGRKIFVFKCIHNTGKVQDQFAKHFKEFQWVPKPKLREFLDETNYNRMINCLTH